MHMNELSLENLSIVKGGLVSAMMSKALGRISTDIKQAPDIDDWRSVTLKIRARPYREQGQLSGADVEFIVDPKTPSRVTSARMDIRSTATGAIQLFFADDYHKDADPNQIMLPIGGEKE
jgi:hypothetical protein